RLAPAEDGTLRSTVFPGLWLDPTALMRDDFDTLLDVLQRGLDSPEHAEQNVSLATSSDPRLRRRSPWTLSLPR
ncbi:MAG: hypothetical protein WBC80_25570, partial [Isosphaeraceae bacterium]